MRFTRVALLLTAGVFVLPFLLPQPASAQDSPKTQTARTFTLTGNGDAAKLQAAAEAVSTRQARPRVTFIPLAPNSVVTMAGAPNASTGAATVSVSIPLWQYSLISSIDNISYGGFMIGASPLFHGHRTTTIQAYLVPIVMEFSDGTILNPNASNPCIGGNSVLTLVEGSPIFQNASYTMNGVTMSNTQYVDAFQRANFWNLLSATGNKHHTTLNLSVLQPFSVIVGSTAGVTALGNCGLIGLVDIAGWDSFVQKTLIPDLAAQGVGPSSVPILIFDSVALVDSGTCCALGYHSAYATPQNILQTYGTADFDSNQGFSAPDISVLSHEVAEWLNDPTVQNLTPSWGHTGQVTGCQNDLEVGDPLSGTLFPSVTLNGFTYHPQELAFFSWFFRQSPSIGSGGRYSNNGSFITGAGPVCH